MGLILGVDPGHLKTAIVIWDTELNQPMYYEIIENERLLSEWGLTWKPGMDVVIEMVASYGMAVGKTVFETVFFIGRLWQTIENNKYLVYRKDIKMHFCNSMRAKDSNIRQALIDRFGSPGTKKQPGLTYGIHKDLWSALAVSVYWADLMTIGK